jgi:hypothetical protein
MLVHYNILKRKLNKIIKAVFIAALMIPFLFEGSYTYFTNDLKSVEYIYKYPVSFYKEKGKVKIYSLTDTISIFYYGNYVLYQLSPTVKFETGEKIRGTEPYFIFNKKNHFGFLYPSMKNPNHGAKLSVDSFLINRGMKGKDFDIPPDSLWSLHAVVKDKSQDFILEKYGTIKPVDETNFDSIYYYYTRKIKNTEFSFSRKLDSIKRMKLYKVRLIFNEKFSPADKILLPKREFLFEIRDKTVSNPKEIIGFIQRFIKCCDPG